MTAPRPGHPAGGPAGPPGVGNAVEGHGTTVTVGGGPARPGWSNCVSRMLVWPSDARPGGRRRPPDHRPRGRSAFGGRDRGSTTAELAAAMPVLVMLLLAGVMAVSAAGTKLRCASAARDAALAAARGEDGGAAARRVAPDGATVQVSADGDLARATVSAQVRPFGNLLPGFTVSGSAVAAVEPGPP